MDVYPRTQVYRKMSPHNFLDQIIHSFEHNFKYNFDLAKLIENPVSVNTGVCWPQGLQSCQQPSAEYSLWREPSGVQATPAMLKKGPGCLGLHDILDFSKSTSFVSCCVPGPLLRPGAMIARFQVSWSPSLGKGSAAFTGWGVGGPS